MQREDLSDDEILDDMEEEDLTASMKQNGAPQCNVSQRFPVDLGLSPDEKKALYNNSAWRMEVRSIHAYTQSYSLHCCIAAMATFVHMSGCNCMDQGGHQGWRDCR